jgi:hypothetical protein
VLYLAAYLAVRSGHVLVHRVSFATEAGGTRYFHRVAGGDFGPGFLQSRTTQIAVPWSYTLFTPLRWTESVTWKVIPRKYEIERVR